MVIKADPHGPMVTRETVEQSAESTPPATKPNRFKLTSVELLPRKFVAPRGSNPEPSTPTSTTRSNHGTNPWRRIGGRRLKFPHVFTRPQPLDRLATDMAFVSVPRAIRAWRLTVGAPVPHGRVAGSFTVAVWRDEASATDQSLRAGLHLSLLAMTCYELPRRSIYYLSVGAVALRIIGQLAILGPTMCPATMSLLWLHGACDLQLARTFNVRCLAARRWTRPGGFGGGR